MEIQILTDSDSVDEFIKLVNYLKEIGYKQTLESSSINHYYSRLEIAKENVKHERSALIIDSVNNLAKFSKMIANQKDCPPEFIDIVNKEFWNLI